MNSRDSLANVMGLKYNKNVLYPRSITQAKRYLKFYMCHGPYMFDKTGKIFMFNYYKISRESKYFLLIL